MSSRTVILRRNSTRYHSGTKLFVGLVGTVQLSVTPPAPWDTLEGVRTLVLVHTTGQRLGRYWSWGDISQGRCMHKLHINAESLIGLKSSFIDLRCFGEKSHRIVLRCFFRKSAKEVIQGWKENVGAGVRKQHTCPPCPLCRPLALAQSPQLIYMDLQGNWLH